MKSYLDKFEIKDFESFYEIKSEEDNIFWTNHLEKPKKIELLNWCKGQIENKERIFLIQKLKSSNEIIGYGYIDINEEDTAELSYAVSVKYSGQGFGTELIALLIEYIKENLKDKKEIFAWILENNYKSQAIAKKNNLKKEEKKKELFFLAEKKLLNFYKYSLII
ncbi:MAG: GNAT family N-acetyltransferase [Sarcina sp.]